jgi:hypothetical protein
MSTSWAAVNNSTAQDGEGPAPAGPFAFARALIWIKERARGLWHSDITPHAHGARVGLRILFARVDGGRRDLASPKIP